MRTRSTILTEYAVLGAQQGEEKSFEMLISQWHPRLARFAFRLTGDREAARDVMQEVWIAVSRGIGRLESPVRFRGWAYRIVSNKCADWVRKEQSRRRVEETAVQEEAAAAETEPPDDAPIMLLRSALKDLPPEQRSILTLFYLEELRVREIAFALRIPEGTVKSRLYKARKMLKNALEA